MNSEWISLLDLIPPEGVPVATKIDDDRGVRNEQVMKRRGSLYFMAPDFAMYSYYTPTHWRLISPVGDN